MWKTLTFAISIKKCLKCIFLDSDLIHKNRFHFYDQHEILIQKQIFWYIITLNLLKQKFIYFLFILPHIDNCASHNKMPGHSKACVLCKHMRKESTSDFKKKCTLGPTIVPHKVLFWRFITNKIWMSKITVEYTFTPTIL